LDHTVVFADDVSIDVPDVVSFSSLCATGSQRLEREPEFVEKCASRVGAGDLATLVYTSGTTGPPKAAMILHSNIIWTLRSVISMFEIEHGERFLSFLPLSHVAERMMSDFSPIVVGGDTWFAESIGTVARDLHDCRPTIFFGVPRIWEKMRDLVVAKLADANIAYKALDVAAGALIRAAMGLDEAHILISGAAPIHPDLLRFLHGIGLDVMELYGQTETCGPTTCNPQDDDRIGTVGRAIPGVTLEIADDGEILVKGGNVCAGYFHDPESTSELIDEEGWMHSGDTGAIDQDGYLRIIGRKKDLIITAAGQNIAPQDIEMGLRGHELISEAVVIGEGRRYLTALLTLDADGSAEWARKRGKDTEPLFLASDPDLADEVDRFVENENSRRARVEQVRRYRILPYSFSVSSDELTPTLKVKRNVVNHKFRDLIDEMYEQHA
jgi:long-chain acyl-CoA synthetase